MYLVEDVGRELVDPQEDTWKSARPREATDAGQAAAVRRVGAGQALTSVVQIRRGVLVRPKL